MKKLYLSLLIVVIFLIYGCEQVSDKYEAYERGDCPEGMYKYGYEDNVRCVECMREEHCEQGYFCKDLECIEKPKEEVYEEPGEKGPEGIGSCTEREECVNLLGEGAFCSKGKCFPPPEDYIPGQVECTCEDGTKVKALLDCGNADCPGSPKEFTVKDGIVDKTTVSVSFPLSGSEAKMAAVAACGISEETETPSSHYENVIDECPSAWEFKDYSNPCNIKKAFVCFEEAFASCEFGGEIGDVTCIEGQPLIQGEFHEKFIVANPVDLSQVKKISKFRGCYGHDHSGYNVDGQLETERAMRHYLPAKSGVAKMNLYAPFDGTIIQYFTSELAEPGSEPEAWIIGNHSGDWMFVHDHITLEEGLGVLSHVKAGQLVGTTIVDDQFDGAEYTLNQDISTETLKEQWVRGAPLDYMTDEVLAEYAEYGITPENSAFTKEYRDANPCNWNAVEPANTWIYLS